MSEIEQDAVEEREVSEVEQKALDMGWVPQDEFKGDPEKWRPAEDFVQRGENFIPILRDQVRKLQKELDTVTRATKSEIKRVREESYDRAKAEYEKTIEQLQKKKQQAAEAEDFGEYIKVENELSSVKPPPEPKDEPEQQQVSPVFEDWAKKNTWYAPDVTNPGGADEDLTLFAMSVGPKIAQENPGLPEKEFLGKVEERVRKTFPHKFNNPRRDEPNLAEGGGTPKARTAKKTWADIPKDDRDGYFRAKKRLETMGRDYKKEDFVKDYFEAE